MPNNQMLDRSYTERVHEVSRRTQFRDPAIWVEFFYELGRYVDNEFYRELGRDPMTRGYPSVLVRRNYDLNLRDRVLACLGIVESTASDDEAKSLSKQGLVAADGLIRNLQEISERYLQGDERQPERFYQEGSVLVSRFVGDSFRLAEQVHVLEPAAS